MSTRTTVEIWQTVKHWAIKGRPATQKRHGGGWIGMPGSENPKPGHDYRIEIVWGPRLKVTGVENWLEHVQLRVVFEGWQISDKIQYQSSIQFYTDSSFSQPTSTPWRVHLEHGDTVFQPYFADVADYAYFRVTAERNRAWRMKYNIGLYGSVYQGTWKRVTAR